MIHRVFVALLCAVLATQRIDAVVNSGPASAVVEDTDSGSKTSEISSSATNVAESVVASTDAEANRRDAPIVPHEVYGAPQNSFTTPQETYGLPSYVPEMPSNPGLPVPVYGVPDRPSTNAVYPGPPADILPSLPTFSPPKNLFNPPKEFYAPLKEFFGFGSNQYGSPKDIYGPPKLLSGSKPVYGPPPTKYGPPPPASFPKLPKPSIPGSFFKPKPFYSPVPKIQYGLPPKSQYGLSSKPFFKPKPFYGLPPKTQYNPPPKPIYGPPIKQHIPAPAPSYGPQNIHGSPSPVYGPLDPVPHGPPHPGAPAPPTPPDIKYDGWQPIAGLISRPSSDTYGVPHSESHNVADLQFNSDFVPPPAIGKGLSSLSLGSSYGSSAGVSDSYGAPLNTVTGTGNIISTSGDAHIHNQDQSAITLGLSAAGIGNGHNGQLSVVKSIGYEIFPNGQGHSHGHGHSSSLNSLSSLSDNYGTPPATSYTPSEPYPSGHSPKHHSLSSIGHNSFGKGLSFSSSSIGLIPPSGVYGVPPNGQYGTSLLHKGPKQPILFRDPVPQGLIQSIGNHVVHNDAAGIIESPGSFTGPQYISPPVKNEPKPPSNLYSLPTSYSSTQFQNSGFKQTSFGRAQAAALTSYNAPVGNIDQTYGVPAVNGLIDLTHLGSNSFHSNIPHDCNAHKFQTIPQLSYGVPLANSYTASLSSLTTNIDPSSSSSVSALSSVPLNSYGTPDLQAAYTVPKESSVNTVQVDTQADTHSKVVAEGFAPGSELIKSQSIDFNNIPLQGAFGSYTLQIQPADGAAGTGPSSIQVPHDQVLNDGLLQSILAAIEQPEQKHSGGLQTQPLLTISSEPNASPLPGDFQLPSEAIADPFNKQVDDEGQHTLKKQVVVVAPTVSQPESTKETMLLLSTSPSENHEAPEEEASVQLIDENEIALYFNNKADTSTTSQKTIEPLVTDVKEEAVRSSKSESYVSFQTPTASYSFGDVKPKITN